MKRQGYFIISSFLVSFLLFTSVSCNSTRNLSNKQDVSVVILHTNDMHARIDNFGKLKYLADSIKRMNPYVFLVSAGDNFTGNPAVDMVPDKGYPMIDLMNRVGYNLSAIGNHEFDLGQDFLNKRIRQAHFPFISCNMNTKGAVLKQPKPYMVLKAGKMKVPFLSAIQLDANGLPASHPSRMEGIKFSNGIISMMKYSRLKKKYGVLIGLTHLGIEDDVILADSMPKLDVILGGHSHTLIEIPKMKNGVMIVQAGSGLQYVGKTTLTFRGKKLIDRKYSLISLNKFPKEDDSIKTLIKKYSSNKELEKVIAIAEAPIKDKSELGSLMTDAITAMDKLDFAFQNNGGIRISSINVGNITLNDVYRLDPFGNQVVVFKMNLAEIKSLIVNAYKRGPGLDLQVSGLKYTIFVDQNRNYSDILITDLNNKPLDPAKEYSVGLNSYVAASYTFDHHDPGRTIYTTTAQTLIDYLQKEQRVNYSGVKRAEVKLLDK